MNLTDLEAKKSLSQMLYAVTKESWGYRNSEYGAVHSDHDSFSGNKHVKDRTGVIRKQCSDGIGTKIQIAERLEDFSTLAFDLFAMTCDDGAAAGFEPVSINTILSVNVISPDHARYHAQLADGYMKAAMRARVRVFNGETAELGSRVAGYGPFNLDWVGTADCAQREGRQITGLNVQPGDVIVSFEETGFRSNGFTKIRDILEKKYGPEWHKDGSGFLGRALLAPSIIYTPAIIDAYGGVDTDGRGADIHAIAHVTGGGIPEKLGRALAPSGMGAELNGLHAPSPIMTLIQELGGISNREAYSRFNMGNGMLVVCPERSLDAVFNSAAPHRIQAKVAGVVVSKPGIKFRAYDGEELKFP